MGSESDSRRQYLPPECEGFAIFNNNRFYKVKGNPTLYIWSGAQGSSNLPYAAVHDNENYRCVPMLKDWDKSRSTQVIADSWAPWIQFPPIGENTSCQSVRIHPIVIVSECLIMAAEAKMTLKHVLGTISAVIPVSLVIYILFALFRYLGFMNDETVSAKGFFVNVLIFLIVFSTATWSCKIWGKLLLKFKVIDKNQARRYPFHKPVSAGEVAPDDPRR